ncbi:MAG: peptide chain release factor N(5)-glutamine methyltransferase [Actinomycetia bacterium]|nr:peptide chain release factor N(5)-glutamine methyltransferase [Actinomycetes bacterium]
MPAWTVKRLLEWGIEYFSQKQVSQPRLSAELLLSSVLNLSRMKLYLNYDYQLSEPELKQFKKLILKRLDHVPIQYILGQAHFRNISLKVNSQVLIPRPETELLVDKALEIITDLKPSKINILEVGTGSGAIAISLAQEIAEDIDINLVATDNSSQAIELATENAEAVLGSKATKIEFITADVVPGDSKFLEKYRQKINVVISNPPYISEENYKQLDREITEYEPRNALVGGATGSEAYEHIFEAVKPLLSDSCGYLVLEVDPLVSDKARDLCRNIINPVSVEIKKDYNQKDRILLART